MALWYSISLYTNKMCLKSNIFRHRRRDKMIFFFIFKLPPKIKCFDHYSTKRFHFSSLTSVHFSSHSRVSMKEDLFTIVFIFLKLEGIYLMVQLLYPISLCMSLIWEGGPGARFLLLLRLCSVENNRLILVRGAVQLRLCVKLIWMGTSNWKDYSYICLFLFLPIIKILSDRHIIRSFWVYMPICVTYRNRTFISLHMINSFYFYT